MTILSASEARAGLYGLIDQTSRDHEPVFIKGKRHSAVLISEADWVSIKETIHLLSVPGMRESIKEGLETPLSACHEPPKW